MKALLIDDDCSLGNNLCRLLEKHHIKCDYCSNSSLALSMLDSLDYNIILLDLCLPDIHGNKIISYIRNHKHVKIKSLPILVLSSACSISDKVTSLSLGADDYISKPFSVRELVTRISTIVRRCLGHPHHIIQTGSLSVNINSKKVYIKNHLIRLTGKEYELIELLILKLGTSMNKDTIVGYLYVNHTPPGLKVIDVLICKIRRKFSCFDSRDYIITDWGIGYMMSSFPIDSDNLIPDYFNPHSS